MLKTKKLTNISDNPVNGWMIKSFKNYDNSYIKICNHEYNGKKSYLTWKRLISSIETNSGTIMMTYRDRRGTYFIEDFYRKYSEFIIVDLDEDIDIYPMFMAKDKNSKILAEGILEANINKNE